MEERNRSVDIFRYICAILVVAIHTHPFSDVDERLGYVFTQIIPRIAVPFFFIVAGYFYSRNLRKKKEVFIPYIKRIVKCYAIWSIPYFVVDFLRWGHQNIKSFAIECIYAFTITGSHYHYWFFPALIIAVSITTVLYKLRVQKLLIPISLILYIIGCLGSSYRSWGKIIPVLSVLYCNDNFYFVLRTILMAFPFFAAGSLAYDIEGACRKYMISKKTIIYCVLGAIIGWLGEIIAVIHYQLQDSITITFGLYFLIVMIMVLLLQYPMPQADRVSRQCHFLADFTYYVHPLVIYVLEFAAKCIGIAVIPETILFVVVMVTTCLAGLMLYRCKKD